MRSLRQLLLYLKINHNAETCLPPISRPKLSTTPLRNLIVPASIPVSKHSMFTPANIDLGTILILTVLLIDIVVVDCVLDRVPVIMHVTVAEEPR